METLKQTIIQEAQVQFEQTLSTDIGPMTIIVCEVGVTSCLGRSYQ